MSEAWKSILQRQRSPEEHFDVMNHVLVIDDDHVLGDLVREFLATEGFTVDVAYDYATGLALFIAPRFNRGFTPPSGCSSKPL